MPFQNDAFDVLTNELELDPRAALENLTDRLALARESKTPSNWREYCKSLDEHPALALLVEDPYTRHARAKRAGYAGDARTLDYVYGRQRAAEGTTALGNQIFEVTTQAQIAGAVRDRCDAIATMLLEALEQGEVGTVSVASIACGHCPELSVLTQQHWSRMAFWGVDQDEATIRSCNSEYSALSCMNAAFVAGSISRVIRGSVQAPMSHMIYVPGLFDYLATRLSVALIQRLTGSLHIGGSLVIANLTPSNREIAFLEAVLDWWMIYRTASDLGDIAVTARLDPSRFRHAVWTSRDRRIAWLRIQRVL